MFKRIHGIAVFLVSASLIYAILVQFAHGWWLIELFSHFRLYMLLVCGVGTALLVLRLAIGQAIAGVLVACWLVWPALPYVLGASLQGEEVRPPPESAAPDMESIRILMWNVRIGNEDAGQGILDFVDQEDPDVVVLFEVWLDLYRDLFNEMRGRYEHHVISPREDSFGLWAFTRLPLVEDRSGGEGGEFLKEYPIADVVLESPGGREIRLLGIHPPPPLGPAAAGIRDRYLRAAARMLALEERPVIWLGDFNCTPFSPRFREVRATAGVRDTAWGHGPLPSWEPLPVPWFGLPLSHVLIRGPSWSVLDRRLLPRTGSDHRPITVEIGWPR